MQLRHSWATIHISVYCVYPTGIRSHLFLDRRFGQLAVYTMRPHFISMVTVAESTYRYNCRIIGYQCASLVHANCRETVKYLPHETCNTICAKLKFKLSAIDIIIITIKDILHFICFNECAACHCIFFKIEI